MILKDITELTRQAVAQVMGETYMTEHGYLEAIPADKLVEVGKDLTDVDMNAEKFTKALSVILAKREIYADEFKPFYSDIVIDRIEWGSFIERGYISDADIMDDPMLSLTDGTDYSGIEHKFYQPKVHTKVYEEGKGIMIPISIQRELLMESFRGYEEMGSYIAKIKGKVRNTLKKAIDRFASILVEAGIAVSVKGTQTAVYLLTEATAAGIITAQTTAAQALTNPAFLAFMAERITEVRDNFLVESTAYNNGTYAVSSSDNKLYLHSKIARALQFGLNAGTFNKEDVKLDYKSIPAWQSSASSTDKKFPFATTSKVSFAADPTNKLGLGTTAVEIGNVAAFLFDSRAIGLTVYKEYTTNTYTACADFWTEFIHSLTNQLLDSTFPMVAFLLDREPQPQQ